jgi:hypothetical protein
MDSLKHMGLAKDNLLIVSQVEDSLKASQLMDTLAMGPVMGTPIMGIPIMGIPIMGTPIMGIPIMGIPVSLMVATSV